ATNGAHRVLCTLSFDLLDLSPQLLGYFELHRSKLGASISRPLGDAVVAYGEWAGGPENSVFERANGLKARGVFRNDVATGFSWTVSTVTFNLEYHFHDAGFGREEWRNWFSGGSAPGAANAFWLVRGYASDQQEPMSRHQLFLR